MWRRERADISKHFHLISNYCSLNIFELPLPKSLCPGLLTFALGSGALVEVLVGQVHLQSLLDKLERGRLIALCLRKLHKEAQRNESFWIDQREVVWV